MRILLYGNYIGSIEVSMADKVLHGKVLHINDTVTYEAENITKLQKEFEIAVDDYIDFCKLVGKTPENSMDNTGDAIIIKTKELLQEGQY